jgi:lysophospholipase L1-like esterase
MRFPVVLLAAMSGVMFGQSTATKGAPVPWVGTWATSPMDGERRPVPTVVDSTLREVVHTSIAGKQLRVRLTNEFGIEPLRVGAATLALRTNNMVDAASLHDLTFGGSASIVIPPGAEVLSDAVPMATPAMADLAISVYLPLQQVSNASAHFSAQQENYIVQGNHVRETVLTSPNVVPSWFFIKGVDVEPAAAHAGAVVAFGDSITDGAYVTMNSNHRWPDYLASRLQGNAATAHLAVLNEGIGGNCVLIRCTAENALARFDRDVLAQAGVTYVIILESINDIGRLKRPNLPDYKLTAEDLEQGLEQMVSRAHEHGIKVIGATLTPYKGAGYFTDNGEAIRQAVNQWILTSGVFDGTVDFDKATRDPANPLMFAPQYDSGDHLHPKDAGYAAMGDAFDLGLFK